MIYEDAIKDLKNHLYLIGYKYRTGTGETEVVKSVAVKEDSADNYNIHVYFVPKKGLEEYATHISIDQLKELERVM